MKSIFSHTRLLTALLLITVLLGLVFVSCTQNDEPSTGTEDVTATDADTTDTATQEPATLPETETDAPDTDIPTETETETEETVTENPSARINIPTDPAHVTFYEPTNYKIQKVFKDRNQCRFDIKADETYGSVLKLTATANANDPYIMFHYDQYMKNEGLTPVSADEYKCIVMTIRAEDCTSETFEMFYCAGAVTDVTIGCSASSSFNASADGWQYILFDLSDAVWSGDAIKFRFDFLATAGKKSESIYIYAMDFYPSMSDAYAAIGVDVTRPGEGSDLTEEPVAGVEYDKITAPEEDASVDMWFDHMTEKYDQTNTTSSGRYTYVIHMAGNSIEDCQFFLSPESDRSFSVSLSDFSDGNGHTLTARLFYEHYAEVLGEMLPDALPPLEGNITVSGGHSQGFVVKVWADADQPAGLYEATVNVTDAATGKIIKTAKVYTQVYGFSLSEETALRSAVGLSAWSIYVTYHNTYGMTDLSSEELYKIYYDFLLENRLCAYNLPYNLNDSRVTEYLNNPRVNSFVINKISGDVTEAYNILKNEPAWMKKGFYYFVDEPSSLALLQSLASYGQQLEEQFPGYQQVSPFFTDITVGDTDQIEYMKPYINIWCTKPFALTPRDKMMVAGTQYVSSTVQEAQYGTFAERMAALKERGDELWLYVCWEPEQPYVNWLVRGDGTEPIVSIWQCKMAGASGILYWDATYWNADPMNDLTPLVGTTSQGDGILLYSGAQIGSYEPISSIRLETVRMGIQDYQLLTMLEEALGEEAAAEMVAMVTEDVITYTSDDDYLHAVRVLLLQKVADALQ